MSKVKTKNYTKGEEIFSGVSHIAGGGLFLLGGAALAVLAVFKNDLTALISCIVFAFSMVLLYTMSGLYHMLKVGKAKRFFRVMDHNSIFLLIAGTYTPYSLVALGGTKGLLLFCFNWVLAIVGVVFNSINLEKARIPSLFCYVLMGWSVLSSIGTLIQNINFFELAFLFLGGIFYTGGIAFYIIKKKYFHSIWHLFVVFGTLSQFVSIFSIVSRL